MNINELEKLAKAATPGRWEIDWYICREAGEELWRVPISIGPIHPDENHWARDHIGTSIDDTNYIAAANPQTILAMIELLREMGRILEENEWITYNDPDWGKQVFCPECGQNKKFGHSVDPKCSLAESLAQFKELTK